MGECDANTRDCDGDFCLNLCMVIFFLRLVYKSWLVYNSYHYNEDTRKLSV